MALLTSCCYVFSLKSGTTVLLIFYWWMSVTYVALLTNYFSEHTVQISLLIGLIFVIWVACSSLGLYGIFNGNAYYLIPQIISDLSDCIQVFVNLIYEVFTHNILIPRYTTFGANWRGDIMDDTNDGSISIFLYNLFDERYPLPTPFAVIDIIIRLYFLLIIVSCFQELWHRRKKRASKKSKKRRVTSIANRTRART